MKSLRAWLCGIALGVAFVLSSSLVKAQVPSGFTYQGVLEENGSPYTGDATFNISLDDANGNELYTETLQNQFVQDGIFNLLIGGPAGFPAAMTFNEQYFIQVAVTSGGGTITLPASALWSSPYAINAGTVNGLAASSVPIAGELFPLPLTLDPSNTLARSNSTPVSFPSFPTACCKQRIFKR